MKCDEKSIESHSRNMTQTNIQVEFLSNLGGNKDFFEEKNNNFCLLKKKTHSWSPSTEEAGMVYFADHAQSADSPQDRQLAGSLQLAVGPSSQSRKTHYFRSSRWECVQGSAGRLTEWVGCVGRQRIPDCLCSRPH